MFQDKTKHLRTAEAGHFTEKISLHNSSSERWKLPSSLAFFCYSTCC